MWATSAATLLSTDDATLKRDAHPPINSSHQQPYSSLHQAMPNDFRYRGFLPYYHSTTAPQHHSTTAPQHHSTTAPQCIFKPNESSTIRCRVGLYWHIWPSAELQHVCNTHLRLASYTFQPSIPWSIYTPILAGFKITNAVSKEWHEPWGRGFLAAKASAREKTPNCPHCSCHSRCVNIVNRISLYHTQKPFFLFISIFLFIL